MNAPIDEIFKALHDQMQQLDDPEGAVVKAVLNHALDSKQNMNITSQWQPAETAPKDGKPFLAWCPNFPPEGVIEIACYYTLSRTAYDPVEGGLFRAREETYASGWNCNYFTHWMPMPEPPK